jgi:hypothetical protein
MVMVSITSKNSWPLQAARLAATLVEHLATICESQRHMQAQPCIDLNSVWVWNICEELDKIQASGQRAP